MTKQTKTRYVQVGVGGRSLMYSEAIVETFAQYSQLVGLCDNNEGRLRLRQAWARERGVSVPIYQADQFDQMIAETEPDVVIVTSKDCTHDHYICRAMELGCDVITEKPMTTDAAKCQHILDTQARTGRRCRVTFNYRYAPPTTQVKDLLMSGVIGDVRSVDFHWLLDTNHGADYFRRWHRQKHNSGGLMVHKATHHFDLINWWLSTVPETVSAIGARTFYTPQMADRYGLTRRGDRCLNCAEADRCPFYLDLRQGDLKALYLDNEGYDGYYRDGCVFSPDIDIEDTMHVMVQYRNGAMMSYSLHAYTPWEGFSVAFNGSRGRLDHVERDSTYVSGDGATPGVLIAEATHTTITPHFASGYDVEVWTGEGGHGGGDPVLLRDIFDPNAPPDRYLRAADYRSGAWSILVGVAANLSMANGGQPVRICDLVHGLPLPDYPPMPSAAEPIDPVPLKAAADTHHWL